MTVFLQLPAETLELGQHKRAKIIWSRGSENCEMNFYQLSTLWVRSEGNQEHFLTAQMRDCRSIFYFIMTNYHDSRPSYSTPFRSSGFFFLFTSVKLSYTRSGTSPRTSWFFDSGQRRSRGRRGQFFRVALLGWLRSSAYTHAPDEDELHFCSTAFWRQARK